MICRAPKCYRLFLPGEDVVAAVLRPRVAGRSAALTCSMHRSCAKQLGLKYYRPITLPPSGNKRKTQMKTVKNSTSKKTVAAATKTAAPRAVHTMEQHALKVGRGVFSGGKHTVTRETFVTFMKKYAPAVYSTLAKKLEKAGYIVRKAEEVKRGRKMEALAA